MQQRQLRLGDILDDYCPRERRVTNHAIVAMTGDTVVQTRCTACDTEHEFKHAKVPRQRRKTETPAALYAQVLSNGPKRVVHERSEAPAGADAANAAGEADEILETADADEAVDERDPADAPADSGREVAAADAGADSSGDAADGDQEGDGERDEEREEEEGPVHRPLIRASLPRHEGQLPPSRPIPEFTIRQPGGRPNRFRPRGAGGAGGGGGGQFQGGGGNRSNGNFAGGQRGNNMRSGGGGRPNQGGGMASRRHRGHGGGKRSK